MHPKTEIVSPTLEIYKPNCRWSLCRWRHWSLQKIWKKNKRFKIIYIPLKKEKILSCNIITLISLTSTVISVSNPLRTCNEVSKSSVIPIFAYKIKESSHKSGLTKIWTWLEKNILTYKPARGFRNEEESRYQYYAWQCP